jgi:alpha-mannosidase
MEFLYRETEWLALISAILRNDLARARQVDITDGWKIILTNQFHDIIPGSSINEVYKDSKKDYELAENIANSIKQEAINELIKPAVDTYTVINNSNWLRSETIKIKTNKKGKYIDNHGTELSSYVEREHTYVTIQNVPPMGFSEIYFQNNEVNLRSKPNFIVDKNTIETPFYIITLNNYGHITRLYDKQYNKEILKHGDRANVFQIFEDKPLDFDAWDIDIFYQEKMREVKDLISKDVSDTNSLCLTVSFKWKYMSSDIEQDMIMYTDNRRIDFKTKVNYREKNQLIKAAFPVNIRSSYATYDIQYGNVRRATNWNTSWDMAKFETVAHRWVDLSESNYGVSLLNDCKYGHDIKDNMIRITLLKGATHPDYLQDQGEHLFTYSLLPHRGSFIEGETAKQAFYLNQPLQIIEGALKYDITSFINIDDECVELDAIKLSEDKNYIVLRLHEYTGGTHKVNIDVCFDFDYHVESDLMERPISEHKTDKKISLIFSPYEIKTILIKIN